MTTLEQKALNAINAVLDTGAELIAAKNPAYAQLIGLLTGTADSLNQQFNPSAPAAAQTIATTAAAISGAVSPTITAINTVKSGSANATNKASAISQIVATAETIGKDLIALFK